MRSPKEILDQIKLENPNKESNRIDWDSKWLGHAFLTAMRSSDARTKCGCILVRDNSIVSEGFNGFIRGIDDNILPNYEGHTDPLLSKYTWMSNHSETNAIINAARLGRSTNGSTAYITTEPCVSCYQQLWQAGIVKIIIPDNDDKAFMCKTEQNLESLSLIQFLTDNRLPIIHRKCNIKIDKIN